MNFSIKKLGGLKGFAAAGHLFSVGERLTPTDVAGFPPGDYPHPITLTRLRRTICTMSMDIVVGSTFWGRVLQARNIEKLYDYLGYGLSTNMELVGAFLGKRACFDPIYHRL
jgi:hypothetical protein